MEKQIIAYCNGFRYTGILVKVTDDCYIIQEIKSGVVHLPKQNTVLIEVVE